MTGSQILSHLDNYKWGYYCHFIDLGHGYSSLIDCRLNLFKAGDEWAIAAERLGFSPRAGRIGLNIFYFGNCLINLEQHNGQDTNYYTVWPVDDESFFATVDGEALTAEPTLKSDPTIPTNRDSGNPTVPAPTRPGRCWPKSSLRAIHQFINRPSFPIPTGNSGRTREAYDIETPFLG